MDKLPDDYVGDDQFVKGPTRYFTGLNAETCLAIRPFIVEIEYELARRGINDATITLEGCTRIPPEHIPPQVGRGVGHT